MNRIFLSLTCIVLIFLFFSNPANTQDYRLIDLNNSTIDAPSLDFYILDVFDNRALQSSVGIVKSRYKNEVVMLNFDAGLHDELMNYFNTTYPAEEGKNPIILNIKKLWITEFQEEEDIASSRCEIVIEFLTPKSQKFYECSDKNEMVIGDNPNALQDNIIATLYNCFQYLRDADLKETYYAVLRSDAPKVTSAGVNEQDIYIESSATKVASTLPKARIAFQGGYTYRTGTIPEGIDQPTEDHLKGLKNGYNLGGDINYFWNAKHSIGVSTSFSQAKSTLADVSLYDEHGNIIATDDLSENIKLIYFGPSYFHRASKSNGKIYLLFSLTMGYYGYNETLNWNGETAELTGETFGLGFSFGADFLTSEKFAIGLEATLLAGSLKKLTIDGIEVELDDYESLTRIDLTIGIRFLP